MIPVSRNQNWLPSNFNDFFDNDWMVKANATAPAINVFETAKEYKVDGVIDVNLKFCSLYDVEGYTVERALKEAGIPVMGIETDYTDNDAEQLRTRIGAFIEMIGTK